MVNVGLPANDNAAAQVENKEEPNLPPQEQQAVDERAIKSDALSRLSKKLKHYKNLKK